MKICASTLNTNNRYFWNSPAIASHFLLLLPSWLNFNQPSVGNEDLLIFGGKKINPVFLLILPSRKSVPCVDRISDIAESRLSKPVLVWVCRMFGYRASLKRFQWNDLLEARRRHQGQMYWRKTTWNPRWPGGKGGSNQCQSYLFPNQLVTLGKCPCYNPKNLEDTEDCFEQWLVMSFFPFFQFVAFTTLCPLSCPTSFEFSVSFGFSLFVYMCVWLFWVLFFSLLLDLSVVFLSFQSSPPSAMVNQKMVFNPSKAQSLRPA